MDMVKRGLPAPIALGGNGGKNTEQVAVIKVHTRNILKWDYFHLKYLPEEIVKKVGGGAGGEEDSEAASDYSE